MSHLTLLAPSPASTLRPALAHDIRNAMAVIALNVEKLEDLAGSRTMGPVFHRRRACNCFRTASAPNSSATNGHGLLIARDLAERNGGTLQLAEVPAGTQFVLALSSLTAIDTSTSRSLGQRVASCSR